MVYSFDPNAERYSHENAKTLCFLSKAAYLEPDEFKEAVQELHFDEIHCISRDQATAYVVAKDNGIITVFRGSERNHLDWRRNMRSISFNRGPGQRYGSVHEGFQKVTTRLWFIKFNSPSIQELMFSLQKENPKYWFTGHSQGGAAASICAAFAKIAMGLPVKGVYVFGSPRFAKKTYQQKYNTELLEQTYRFENNNDLVTRVPPSLFSFHHVGNRVYIDSARKLHLNPDNSFVEDDRELGKRLAKEVGDKGLDCITDHAIEHYLKALSEAINLS